MKPRATRPGRLPLLVGVLVACVAALPLSWLLRGRGMSPLPASASVETQRAYWQRRIQADVSDREAFLQLGLLEERTGFYNAAVRYLSGARALGADEATTCGPLGRAFTQLARDDEALPELEQAVRLAPKSVDAAANLAGLYINQDQPKAAGEVLRRFVAADPDMSPADSRRVAVALLECGDSASARSLAERLVAATPGDLLARGIAVRGAIAARDFPVARNHLEAILQAAPDDAGSLYLYGNVLAALGDRDGALKQWQKAVVLNPRALDVYERIGNAYVARGDFAHAAVAYETLARRAPSGTTAAHASVALARSGQGRRAAYWHAVAAGFAANYPEALRWGQIAAAAPDPATRRLGLQAMAEAYRGMRQREPYLATMRKLTAGGSLDDLLLMAQAWGQADRHEERTEWLQRAVKIAPPERRADILHALGMAYSARGMRDPAEHALEEAAALDQKNIALLSDLAHLYFDRRSEGGRLEKAIHLRETVLAAASDDANNWEQLGLAYSAAEQAAKAVRCLEHAIDLEPGDGPAYLELSKAYAALGDTQSSRRLRSLYAKFVAYDQNRQTLRTRAWRPGATVADVKAYADLMYKIGAFEDAAQWYEKAHFLSPQDKEVRERLIAAYTRLRRVDRVLELRTETKS